MRTNYFLVDYENVQPEAMSALEGEHLKVIVFVGSNQSKVNFEVAASLQKMGSRAEYIKISGSGPNSLDFHIAYYIGVIATTDPKAYFHIISKDTGFDPLIAHLKTLKISACRSISINEVPVAMIANAKTVSEQVTVVVNDLKRRGASKPRTLKTLNSTINSIFQKQLSEKNIESLINELKSKGLIKVDGLKVSYSLP